MTGRQGNTFWWRRAWPLGLLAWLLGWLALAVVGCYRIRPLEERQALSNELDRVVGQAELIIPAEQGPDDASLSPNGRWLVVKLGHNGGRFRVLDLVEGTEQQLSLKSSGGIRWLTDDLFVSYFATHLVYVPELRVVELERVEAERIAQLQGEDVVYLLPNFGDGNLRLVSANPDHPCAIRDVSELDLDQLLPGTRRVEVPPEYWGNRSTFFSPDESFYAGFISQGLDVEDSLAIWTQDGKVVAEAWKEDWDLYPIGWAYDTSGFYFGAVPAGGGMYLQDRPVFKLLVPGAELRGTPAPIYKPKQRGLTCLLPVIAGGVALGAWLWARRRRARQVAGE